MRVYGEPLIQHLTLDESEYFNREWDYAARRVMSPPFRDKSHQDWLWAGLVGRLAAGGRDRPLRLHHRAEAHGHRQFHKDPERHRRGRRPALRAWTKGVETGRITPNEFVAVTSTNIAQILNIYPQKGAILVGSDADICVFDPKLRKTISAANQKSIIDYNVFEGFEVGGLPRYVLSRGEVVWSHGKNDQPRPGRGSIRRKPFPAVNRALSKWKELTAPRAVMRSPEHMPIGV